MESLLAQACLNDWAGDFHRNIVSLKESQDLFDDLSDDPADTQVAQAAELAAKPPTYSDAPVIHRPFEEAEYLAAIQWPFDHWTQSRYSNGRFGVWYGALDLLTSVHETLHHWRYGLLADAGFDQGSGTVVTERKIYRVRADALLIDLRATCRAQPGLLDGEDYGHAQTLGERLARQGHPGLLSRSARGPGEIAALFTPKVLSNPRMLCYLDYCLDRASGEIWVSRGSECLLVVNAR